MTRQIIPTPELSGLTTEELLASVKREIAESKLSRRACVCCDTSNSEYGLADDNGMPATGFICHDCVAQRQLIQPENLLEVNNEELEPLYCDCCDMMVCSECYQCVRDCRCHIPDDALIYERRGI